MCILLLLLGLSVCLFVTTWYSVKTAESIQLCSFGVEASIPKENSSIDSAVFTEYLGLSYTVLYGNSGVSENKGISLWNFVRTLNHRAGLSVTAETYLVLGLVSSAPC